MTLTLKQFADNLAGSQYGVSLNAALDRKAALTLRDPAATQNARNWARQQLSGQLNNRIPMAIFLANPTEIGRAHV